MRGRCAVAVAFGLLSCAPVLAGTPGAAPANAGFAMQGLVSKLSKVWKPACETEVQRQIKVNIRFRLSPGGRVKEGPSWADADSDPDRAYAAHEAMAAVANGQPYTDLPQGLYNTPITIMFDSASACAGR